MKKQEVADVDAADQAFDAARGLVQFAAENSFASGRHHEDDQRVQHSDDGERSDEQEPEPENGFRLWARGCWAEMASYQRKM